MVAVLAGVLVTSGGWSGDDPADSPDSSGADAVPAQRSEPEPPPSVEGEREEADQDERVTEGDTASEPDSTRGREAPAGREAGDDGPREPRGASLQGPRAARMQRWKPRFGDDGSTRAVSARSTVVDAVVRAVSLDTADGRDAVAVRIARGRWDELTDGVASEVPSIVWESIARGVGDAGELREVYAIDSARPAEYILRFTNDQLLLRLYGSSSSVDDAEVEALPRP